MNTENAAHIYASDDSAHDRRNAAEQDRKKKLQEERKAVFKYVRPSKKVKHKAPQPVVINSAEIAKKYVKFCKKHGLRVGANSPFEIEPDDGFMDDAPTYTAQSAKLFEDRSYKYVHASEIDAERRERRKKRLAHKNNLNDPEGVE